MMMPKPKLHVKTNAFDKYKTRCIQQSPPLKLQCKITTWNPSNAKGKNKQMNQDQEKEKSNTKCKDIHQSWEVIASLHMSNCSLLRAL